jgi:hypothetical protein
MLTAAFGARDRVNRAVNLPGVLMDIPLLCTQPHGYLGTLNPGSDPQINQVQKRKLHSYKYSGNYGTGDGVCNV